MDFKNSKTYQNIMNTINGEMMASTRYKIYSDKAKKDGYEQIGDVFSETSHNEKEHAEAFLKIMFDGELPSTLDNLKTSYEGENNEWTKLYKDYAQMAMDEGYPDIANLFSGVAAIENHHDYRFRNLANNIKNDTVFCKDENVVWICMNCGNLWFDKCAPEHCPVCGYDQSYFKINCENY